jgi:ADP-heptose:LPS heptosyltransferase
VLLWPMLRQWRLRGMDVVFVADREKGRLAAQELGIRALDAESARFNALWVPDSPVEPVPSVATVTAYLGRSGEGTQAWMASARRMFPSAAITHRSERPSRPKALRYPLPELRTSESGPAVLHIGAGAEEKRWPVERWLSLTDLLMNAPSSPLKSASTKAAAVPSIRLIAGEVELERLNEPERRLFTAAGGRFFSTLDDLAETIRSARVFVAADSGPGHLAAQMGLPTVSLFGPGDPTRWAPVGPVVKAVSPRMPSSMLWLEPPVVLEAVRLILEGEQPRKD